MNAGERVLAYRKQAGVSLDKPYVLTPKQRRRVKQKGRRYEEGKRQQDLFLHAGELS